jgi:hypothetical protein
MADKNDNKIAEPAALGLLGLAVAALVLGVADIGLTKGSKSLMFPWVLMFGATSQLIASLIDFKRNNIFGATVFGTYSMTMFAIAITILITIFGGEDNFIITHYAYGLIAILFFSLIATVASLMTNKILFGILIAVDLAVISLIPHYLSDVSAVPAGIFLLLTSMLSFYAAAAVLINTMAKKTIIPMGSPIWKP